MSGFSGTLAYALGEVADNNAASRAYGFSASYENGPFSTRVAYHDANNATATDTAKNTLLGADYNFGKVKASLAYAVNKGVGALDSRDILAGIAVPFGASQFVASYIRKDDKSIANKDAHQLGVGYIYSLSKRTDLYAAYGRISNQNGAAYTVGNNTKPGAGDRATNLGIRHTF